MHLTRRLLLLSGLCAAASFVPALHAQTTITYVASDNKTDPITAESPTILTIASGTAEQSGVISGGSIEKQGPGTLTLSGTNTFSGGTTLTAGTLIGTNNSAYGTGTITLAGGDLKMSVGGLTVANAMTVTGASAVYGTDSGSDVTTYTGAIQLNGGTLTLNATNTNRIDVTSAFTGTGNVVIAGNNSGGINSTESRVILASGTTPNFTGNLTINSGGLLHLANNLSTNAVTNNGSLWLASSTGNSSTVTLGSLAGSGVVRVIMNSFQTATLNVGGNNADTTFSGQIRRDYDEAGGPSIALTKSGTGTFTLSGGNIYTGATTVSAGTLLVTGNLISTSSVSVNSGATLGGSGSIGGLTTVASGGHVAPGASVGTLTFNGGLTLQTGSILDFQLGTTSDLIRVDGGTLTGPTGTGGVTLNFSDSGGFTAGTYTLVNYTSATLSDFQATDFSLGSTISGYTYSLALAGSSLQLTASAIPEPSTYAAIFGACALGLAIYRRSKNRSRSSQSLSPLK